MAKETTPKDDLDENLFGGFQFLDKPVPAKANKAKIKEEDGEDDKEAKEKAQALKEAEDKAIAEALAASEAAKAKKSKTEETNEEEEEETEEADEEETPPVNTQSGIQLFAKELANRGLLDLEEDAEIKDDEDLIKAYSKTIKKAVEEDRTGLPEDAQKFLEFLDNGGRPAEFHKLYYGDGPSFEEFTIEAEEDQEHVVREGLMLEGYTEEEANDEIADLKDLNKLDKKAAIQLKKLQKIEKDQKKALLDAQKEYAKKQEEKRLADWTEFKKGLYDKEEISGFKFNDKMKDETWNYMTKVVDKTNQLTQYQIDSASNPDARYMFAYLLKNKWDIKALEKQVTTKTVGKIASQLNNYSDSRAKISKGNSAPKEQVDGDKNSFAAFKTIL